MTEEEIKARYVLPWLTETGVTPSEIYLERSFSIKVGRQLLTIGEPNRRQTARGRLDILVKRDGKNLLIVETKAEDLSLTDDDRDQAISYARLVHPIAPYAVVTNGKEYRLYDSITKAQVTPSDIRVQGFEAALPEADIAEAQKLFLGLNRANLITFCERQVTSELRTIKGSIQEGKKYIPELHVPRDLVRDEVPRFYSSPLPGLVLTGQSGSGKTSEMCWLAEQLLENGKPVLFFNGSSLENSIVEAIATEFAWTFNSTNLPAQVVRRLSEVAGEDQLTIIVDAIDEWTYESRANHFGSILRAAENQKIKIIASCKTPALSSFLESRGNTTSTALLTQSLELRDFTPKEFSTAVDKYRSAYQFFGYFEDIVLKEARSNPFLLRILFDVAASGNVQHLTFSSKEFFDAYFDRAVRLTLNYRQAINTLKAVAEILYERNSDWVSEDTLRSKLALGVNESLMEELFEYGLLLRGENDASTPTIAFYFQQLRDYVVAFKVRKFHEMSPRELADEAASVTTFDMRGEVFSLYYRLASSEHRAVFDHTLRENAEKYLSLYQTLISEHFPSLREAFNPQTSGKIGFIGELLVPQRYLGSYGFRSLDEGDSEVHFVSVQNVIKGSNLSFLDGANQMHFTGSSNGFRSGINLTKEVVEHELLSQLRDLVKNGRLNESLCPEMLTELIVQSVIRDRKIFSDLISTVGQSVAYPLRLEAIQRCLLKEKLINHYRDEVTLRKRQSGELEERWEGNIVSFSLEFTPEEEHQIAEAVNLALNSDEKPIFSVVYKQLEEAETLFTRAFHGLRKTEIEGPLFSNEDLVKAEIRQGSLTSIDAATTFLSELYFAFLSNYKSIVEANFPTLKQHFSLYSKLPLSIHLVLGCTANVRPGINRTSLGVYFSESPESDSVVAVVEDLVEDENTRMLFRTNGAEYVAHLIEQGSFENLFLNTTRLTYEKFRGMTLRKLVYETIMHELETVEDAFRSLFEPPKAPECT